MEILGRSVLRILEEEFLCDHFVEVLVELLLVFVDLLLAVDVLVELSYSVILI